MFGKFSTPKRGREHDRLELRFAKPCRELGHLRGETAPRAVERGEQNPNAVVTDVPGTHLLARRQATQDRAGDQRERDKSARDVRESSGPSNDGGSELSPRAATTRAPR